VRWVQSVRAKCVQDACEGEWSQATVGYGTSGGKWREERRDSEKRRKHNRDEVEKRGRAGYRRVFTRKHVDVKTVKSNPRGEGLEKKVYLGRLVDSRWCRGWTGRLRNQRISTEKKSSSYRLIQIVTADTTVSNLNVNG
jgi:hypothetical protein